jgi:hypothetical protein
VSTSLNCYNYSTYCSVGQPSAAVSKCAINASELLFDASYSAVFAGLYALALFSVINVIAAVGMCINDHARTDAECYMQFFGAGAASAVMQTTKKAVSIAAYRLFVLLAIA